MEATQMSPVRKQVDHAKRLEGEDLHDLCEATHTAILDGGGFGWLEPPSHDFLMSFWRGVLLVPERELFVARLNGTICGSAQLVLPPRNNEAQRYAATVTGSFLAPWARGHGLARDLMVAMEAWARERRLKVLNLDARETQQAAIRLYKSLGYEHWATHPHYAWVRGDTIRGFFFFKDLTTTDQPPDR